MRRHDPFLKRLYTYGTKHAAPLFFPELSSHVRWEKLKWVDKEIPILGLKPRSVVADLVGQTQDTEGRHLSLFIHPEIQMQKDFQMGWRALQYNAGLTLRQADPDARVLTMVFYHCKGVGGIQEQSFNLDYYGRSVLGVGYWSVGLGDLDAEEYIDKDNPMAWALASWMRQQPHGRAETRLKLQQKILTQVPDETYRGLLLDTVSTYYKLNKSEQEEERELLQSSDFGEVKRQMLTEFEKIERRAERKGIQKGEQKGIQDALLTLLHSRFPAVPDSVESGIRKIHDQQQLQTLIQRAATAHDLGEVWPGSEG
ncbi:MAG: hypothetical protein M3Y56_15935 [Armatimonadota bacterium]|nr:hypothetical protein [Armatimonadota bacterium]